FFLNADSIRKLFDDVRSGNLSPDDAVERLRHLPFEDLGFAKVDHHRALRAGMPEVIFGQGKTPAQVAGIFARLAQHNRNVLVTRADEKQFVSVKKKTPRAEYRSLARAILLKRDCKKYGKGKIAVVLAGTSDIPVAEEAVVTAEAMGNDVEPLYDVGVAGIHRLLANRNSLTTARVVIVGIRTAVRGAVGADRAGRGRIPGPVRFGDKEEVSAAGREEAIRLGCSERTPGRGGILEFFPPINGEDP